MLIVRFKNGFINKKKAAQVAKEIKRQIDDNGILVIDDNVEITTTYDAFKNIKVVNVDEVEQEQPLLSIKIQDAESAPVVHIEGEKITGLTNVKLEWETAKELGVHDLHYEIERYVNAIEKEKMGMVVGNNV